MHIIWPSQSTASIILLKKTYLLFKLADGQNERLYDLNWAKISVGVGMAVGVNYLVIDIHITHPYPHPVYQM